MNDQLPAAEPAKAIPGTLRLLASLCFIAGGAIVVGAILMQRPNIYWAGIVLLANGSGLARRLNWARVLSVAGLAAIAAVALLDLMKHRGMDAPDVLAITAATFIAARLWQHPEAFSRRWW